MKQVAQKGGGCSIPGSFQDQVGQGFVQLDPVEDVCACCRGLDQPQRICDFFFDLILSRPARGINPAATFSRVSAKCFAGLFPELTSQAKSKAPVQAQGEQQEHRAGSMARGVELLPVRYLLWHH